MTGVRRHDVVADDHLGGRHARRDRGSGLETCPVVVADAGDEEAPVEPTRHLSFQINFLSEEIIATFVAVVLAEQPRTCPDLEIALTGGQGCIGC